MNMSDYVWLFSNGLNKLKDEVTAYKDENDLWVVEKNIANSAGNLTQHLVGNIKHFIGLHMGQIPYRRERDREFNERQFDRSQLLQMIDETIAVVAKALSGKDTAFMEKPFPEEAVKIKEGQTNGFMLAYLYAHLNYHLGQINYHRRLLS